MSMRPLARRVIAALLLVLLNACYSWRTTTISPAQLIPEEEPSIIRVTLTDGMQLTLRDPTIRNDSLVHENGRARVVLSDVSAVELWHFSVAKTIGIIIPFLFGPLLIEGAR